MAMAYTGLGDRETALAWLERAAREKDPWLYAMSINAPVFDAIARGPAFRRGCEDDEARPER